MVIDLSLVNGSKVLEGQIYDLEEMKKVDKVIAPMLRSTVRSNVLT